MKIISIMKLNNPDGVMFYILNKKRKMIIFLFLCLKTCNQKNIFYYLLIR